MSKILDAIKNVVFNSYEEVDENDGYDDGYEDDYEDDITPPEKPSPGLQAANLSARRMEKAKVIPFNGVAGSDYAEEKIKTQILKAVPKAFEDVARYADLLKDGKVIIINFEEVDAALAQKIMDFLSGVSYITGGSIEMINKSVFTFAPPNAEFILNAMKTDPVAKAHILPWISAGR